MKHHQNITNAQKNQKIKDKAYFASKSELLTWASKTLDIEIKSLEETMTGAIFCQLLDAAHPGSVRMNKVNWKAKLEIEYISNFKLFQQGLSNNNIEKPINIQRLAKGKTMELIELLQWLYGHHIYLGIDNNTYDAIKRRNGNNFEFFGKKMGGKNNIGIRDDISKCSANTDNKDFLKVKNNLKNINTTNITSLNANLRSNNFHTKYNTNTNINSINTNYINKKNKNKRNKSEKISITNSNRSNTSISLSSIINKENKEKSNSNSKNKENNNNNLNTININDIMNSPFIIEEKPEEDEKLNNILFEGISNIDKENILQLEKNDSNNIREMKILIRKLRVNNIIFKSNLGSILNKVTKERDFYLNKLKDIEYLYFNPIIRNTNKNKNELLKSILKSQTDTTIIINEEGFASIKPLNNHFNNDINNTKINSQNIMKIKLAFSKGNKKEENNCEYNDNIYNKTQPVLSNSNRKKIGSNIFPLNSNLNNNLINNNNYQVTPSNKTSLYDISSHILNEELHIPNTENVNPNLINNNIDIE